MKNRPYSLKPATVGHKKRWWFGVIFLLLIGLLVAWFVFGGRRAEAPDPSSDSTPPQTSEPQPSEEPAYEAPNLQPTIDAWVAKQSASYHIVVYDLQADKSIGQNLPDKELFAASLYKLYVAYLALKDFQDGKQNPNQILTGGFTRKQCVDKMIRESHSPCGEAMMANMGQSTLNERVKAMGTKHTFFNGIRTSAQDCALILKFIDEKRDLNAANTAFLLDAMLKQDAMYKRGLATGAPKATWHTKVGWNEDINYHDVGIMTLPDKRKFAVAILGQGSGRSAPIADFAATIYAALTR